MSLIGELASAGAIITMLDWQSGSSTGKSDFT